MNDIIIFKTFNPLTMNKILFGLFVSIVMIIACQPKPKTEPLDLEAEKAAIGTFLDGFNTAFNAKDSNAMVALLTDDVLCCGTDPSEFLNKREIAHLWAQFMADTALTINYAYDRREIRIAADGKSAIIIEQYKLPLLSAKIPLRNIYHVVKHQENWMFDFMSWNFIPKNEDVPKLDQALE
jgi:ketosteroid isomerase-like protein